MIQLIIVNIRNVHPAAAVCPAGVSHHGGSLLPIRPAKNRQHVGTLTDPCGDAETGNGHPGAQNHAPEDVDHDNF